MARVPEIFSSSIVAVGAFNPAIFSPDWLERNTLIGAEDAETARQSTALIISQQVSVVDTDWFTLQVLDNQLTLSSKGVLSPTLRDLAVGIFSLASQTPVTALGMNFVGDYKMATVGARSFRRKNKRSAWQLWWSAYSKASAMTRDQRARIRRTLRFNRRPSYGTASISR